MNFTSLPDFTLTPREVRFSRARSVGNFNKTATAGDTKTRQLKIQGVQSQPKHRFNECTSEAASEIRQSVTTKNWVEPEGDPNGRANTSMNLCDSKKSVTLSMVSNILKNNNPQMSQRNSSHKSISVVSRGMRNLERTRSFKASEGLPSVKATSIAESKASQAFSWRSKKCSEADV